MADKTAIEWTDATWNPIRGCSRVSEGCRHCYAEGVAARFSRPGLPYEGLARRVALPNGDSEARWTNEIAYAGDTTLLKPLRWSKPRRIFVNSMSDLFHENVPDEIIDRVFAVMAFCPQHTFQILTKRPERMRAYCSSEDQAFFDRQFDALEWVRAQSPFDSVRHAHEYHDIAWHQPSSAEDTRPLANVWLGVSVEDQVTADTRIPYLLTTPAAKRFLSCEPLLGPIDIDCPTIDWMDFPEGNGIVGNKLVFDWIIVGGESGPKARPMHPSWARSLRDQCTAASIPFFFKQWGEWGDAGDVISAGGPSFHRFEDGTWVQRYGKTANGRKLDGRTHDEFPETVNE